MKLVKVAIELVIDNEDRLFNPIIDKDGISSYLNNKLYTDPEWFGEFGPENIVGVENWDD
jgi:hypothetical protein